MFCMKCGTKNREGAKFCNECGSSMNYIIAPDNTETDKNILFKPKIVISYDPEDNVPPEENEYAEPYGFEPDNAEPDNTVPDITPGESDEFIPGGPEHIIYDEPEKPEFIKMEEPVKPDWLFNIACIFAVIIVIAVAVYMFKPFEHFSIESNASLKPDLTAGSNNPNYQLLSKNEQYLFDCLIIGVESFYNKSEARLLGVGSNIDLDDGVRFIDIKMQGTNKSGDTLVGEYYLQLDNYKDTGAKYKKGQMFEIEKSSGKFDNKDYNIEKINKALAEYWEGPGRR